MIERGPVTKGGGAHRQVHGLQDLRCLRPLGSTSGYAVEYDGKGFIACIPDKLNGRGNRFQIVDRRTAWDENETRGSRCRHGGLLGPGRRVDQEQVGTLFFGRVDNVSKTGRLSRDDYRGVGLAAVGPVARACLRVKIDDGDCSSGAVCGDCQGYDQGGFPGPALLSDYGDNVQWSYRVKIQTSELVNCRTCKV